MRRNTAVGKRKGGEIGAIHLQFTHDYVKSNTQHLVELYGCVDAPAHLEERLQACYFLLKVKCLVNVHDSPCTAIDGGKLYVIIGYVRRVSRLFASAALMFLVSPEGHGQGMDASPARASADATHLGDS